MHDLATRKASVDGADRLLHDMSPPRPPAVEDELRFAGHVDLLVERVAWNAARRRTIHDRAGRRRQIVYAGTRADAALTLTADRLEITLRLCSGAGGADDGGANAAVASSGIDLGGGGEILPGPARSDASSSARPGLGRRHARDSTTAPRQESPCCAATRSGRCIGGEGDNRSHCTF